MHDDGKQPGVRTGDAKRREALSTPIGQVIAKLRPGWRVRVSTRLAVYQGTTSRVGGPQSGPYGTPVWKIASDVGPVQVSWAQTRWVAYAADVPGRGEEVTAVRVLDAPKREQTRAFGPEADGFALVGQRSTVGPSTGPGQGTQVDLVSRKVDAAKMAEIVERERAARRAASGAKASDTPLLGVGRQDHEERREARVERLRTRAAKARAEAAAAHATARQIADVIPMGQPILVGHHSEKRHRRDIARMQWGMDRAIQGTRKAENLDRRAASAEANRAISSDDPDALRKLQDKLGKLERRREAIKADNRSAGKGDDATLARLRKEYAVVHWHDVRQGHPPYVLTNLGGKIRATQQRIETLQAQANRAARSGRAGDWAYRENPETNRVEFETVSGRRATDEERRELKANGFKWSRTNQVWQRIISNAAWYQAERIAQNFANTANPAGPELARSATDVGSPASTAAGTPAVTVPAKTRPAASAEPATTTASRPTQAPMRAPQPAALAATEMPSTRAASPPRENASPPAPPSAEKSDPGPPPAQPEPEARLEFVDTATGARVAPTRPGAAPTGRVVATIDGEDVVIDPEDLVGRGEPADPRRRRYRFDLDSPLDYAARAKRQKAAKKQAKRSAVRKPKGVGLRTTFSSPATAAKEFYDGNAEFFDHVRDPWDGLRDWMDGVEVGGRGRARKLSATLTGKAILTERHASKAIQRALRYVFGKAKGRRYDAVSWHDVERLGQSLERYFEPYGDAAARPGLYWRPYGGRPRLEDVEALPPSKLEQLRDWESAQEVRTALGELKAAYRKHRKCLADEHRRLVLQRIREWSSWAKEPSRIPPYACEPDPDTAGMLCNYPSVAGELRELARACATDYDPDWATPASRAGAPGFPDTSAGEEVEPLPRPRKPAPKPTSAKKKPAPKPRKKVVDRKQRAAARKKERHAKAVARKAKRKYEDARCRATGAAARARAAESAVERARKDVEAAKEAAKKARADQVAAEKQVREAQAAAVADGIDRAERARRRTQLRRVRCLAGTLCRRARQLATEVRRAETRLQREKMRANRFKASAKEQQSRARRLEA